MTKTRIYNTPIRNSKMELGEVYYWTNTIKDWKHLLKQDKYKLLIINTLKELVDKKLIAVYAFVIMPNHIHLVWELIEKNGNELSNASFNKKVGHEIIKDLKENHLKVLEIFKVEEKGREYRIWKRDPLAVIMDNKMKVEQKIHGLRKLYP